MKFSVLTNRFSLSFQRVALIEADPQFARKMESYCDDIGFSSRQSFTETKDFLATDPKQFDLILLDWSAKAQPSGLMLYNRIRRDPRCSMLPILVISGFVERNDFRLLQEFPLTRLIEKPFTSGVFIDAVQNLENEKAWIRANHQKIHQLIKKPSLVTDKIPERLTKLLEGSPYPIPLLLLIGRYLSQHRLYREARSLFQKIIHDDPGHVLARNELGKILHHLGKHGEALDTLRAADQLSPDHVQRLCHIGELELHELDLPHAKQSFSRALRLDPGNHKAQKGLEVAENAFSFLQSQKTLGEMPKSFASLMNTMGISKVRSGFLHEGQAHYQSALLFIREPEERAKVLFNIALGYLRHKESDQALLWFMRSSKVGGRFFLKPLPYIKTLSHTLTLTEQGLKVNAQRTVDIKADDQVPKLPVQTSSLPWDRGLIQTTESDEAMSLEMESESEGDLLAGVWEEGFRG